MMNTTSSVEGVAQQSNNNNSLRAQRLRQVLQKVLSSATGKISEKAIQRVYQDIITMVSVNMLRLTQKHTYNNNNNFLH